jgi:hypothetical protein
MNKQKYSGMPSILLSLGDSMVSVVDHAFEPRSGQVKDFIIFHGERSIME